MTPSALLHLAAVGLICIAFAVSACATPLSIIIARKTGAMDVPRDERRMHKRPIPRLGGLAIFISFIVCVLIYRGLVLSGFDWAHDPLETIPKLTAVIVGGIIIFFLGAIDDTLNLPAKVKLIGQIACAAVVFFMGLRIPAIKSFGWHFAEDSPGGLIISFILTVFWLVLITNMINLIDGLDGLAAGVAGIAALAISYSSYIHGQYTAAFVMIILAGSALGFLPFNFYPAKAFMGDSGAMFLGFTLAAVAIIEPAKSSTLIATVAPVLVLGVPLFDVGFAVIRRWLRGQPIFSADKEHLHHQLTALGMGQRRSVLMLYGISGIMGIAAIVFSRNLYLEAVGLFSIAVVFILIFIWRWNKHDS
ncbi:MAG: undecaprenyl/decaprenyl-phosphate alpha-N-acetylglucosaminyl 1-phosphate transferase [Clostridiales Family XIII bacterium]|jgi:UDP-GlcNAc:undecaprenyl-phosphate GlcNAc-1-phosphate transferase|nr:undecaprenyl/decaprenyl-phosphate alpha-N-acetylglucosaminyl 1-phosphate transferase [Clostridiales Family XIII bacterium]